MSTGKIEPGPPVNKLRRVKDLSDPITVDPGGKTHVDHDPCVSAIYTTGAYRSIRGARTSEVFNHVKKQSRLLTQLRWGHSLHKVTRDAMDEAHRAEIVAGRGENDIKSVEAPENWHEDLAVNQKFPAHPVGANRAESGGIIGCTNVQSAQTCSTPAGVTHKFSHESPFAPAHGSEGAGGEKPEAAALTGIPTRKSTIGGGTPVRIRAAGGGQRSRADRVARLGSALNEIETRADGSRGKARLGTEAGSGEKSHLSLPCTKRHAKIIRALTSGEGGAGTNAGKGAGTADVAGAVKSTVAKAGTAPKSGVAATGAADGTIMAQAATAPVEGAISLRTVGKTVAFLAKLATPGVGGRGDGGVGTGESGSAAVTGGGSYGVRESWYAAAAARIIAEKAQEIPALQSQDGEAAAAPLSTLERHLHTPAIQFGRESRRGGFSKGSTITYGTTITLQAFHGGIMCFTTKGRAQASALGAQPNALLTVWNLQDLQSKGPMRYGDMLFLQIGRHEVMGSSLIMNKDNDMQGGRQRRGSSSRPRTADGERDQDDTTRDRTGPARTGALSSSALGGGGGGGNLGPAAGASVGKPIAVQFRGKNMDKAKHTGRWVVFNKDDPEGTHGSEVCHLDRIVLQQTWLCLASDAPGDACLKQSGSVDDFSYRQEARPSSRRGSRDSGGMEGSRGDGVVGGERNGGTSTDVATNGVRESRQKFATSKSAFGVRPECAWTIRGVGDAGTAKRPGTSGGGSSGTSRLALIEGAAARQLRRSKHARLVVAKSAILRMRRTTVFTVLNAQEKFDEGQRWRMACLAQKFLRTFQRERARNWLPHRGEDHTLSLVYGPSSSWGKRESSRLYREHTRHLKKATAKANNVGDIRDPPSLEVARAESSALAVEAKVKQEVWDALLKRYGYRDVTDMLALIHSASVIKRAVRAMRRRKWTRKFARIDPEMIEKVDRLRKIQEQRKAKMKGGGYAASTLIGTGGGSADSAATAARPHTAGGSSPSLTGSAAAATFADACSSAFTSALSAESTVSPGAQPPRPYETLLAGSGAEFGAHRWIHEHNDRATRARGCGARPQSSGDCRKEDDTRGRWTVMRLRHDRQEVAEKRCHENDHSSKERQHQQKQGRTRPRTAGAGLGGVHGVLTRLQGYDRSGFREFGGDGKGGAVEQQFARDESLLADLRSTLHDVVSWDHTRGVIEAGAGVSVGSGAGGVMIRDGLASSPDAAEVVSAATAADPATHVRPIGGSATLASARNVQDRWQSHGASGEAAREIAAQGFGSVAGRQGGGLSDSDWPSVVDHVEPSGSASTEQSETMRVTVPFVIGDGVWDDRGTKKGSFEDLRYSPAHHQPLKGRMAEDDGSAAIIADHASELVNSRDGSCTDTMSGEADNSSSSSIWAGDRRRWPVSLTDDERMCMLRHVRPSVFGGPNRNRGRTGHVRPQSAAAVVESARRKCTNISKVRQCHREATSSAIPFDYAVKGVRQKQHCREPGVRYKQNWRKSSKRQGILAHDDWMQMDAHFSAPSLLQSTIASPTVVATNRYRSGTVKENRARSFVNSVAFEVNMGLLEALASNTARRTVSALDGDAFVRVAGTSSSTTMSSRGNNQRGQSAPRARR